MQDKAIENSGKNSDDQNSSNSDEGEIIEQMPEIDPEQHILKMREHLNKVNNLVNLKLGFPEDALAEFISRRQKSEEVQKQAEKLAAELAIEPEEEVTLPENREFAVVTPKNPDNKKSEKGMPSLEAFSVGVAPFERNMIDPSTTKKGTFRKLNKLLSNRVRKPVAEPTLLPE